MWIPAGGLRNSRLVLLPGSMWANMLWEDGYDFENPPPAITAEGFFKPSPPHNISASLRRFDG